MELSLILLVLPTFIKISSCVNCYKCAPEEKYDGSPMCKDFDGSERFIENCIHSTMCFKRETTLDIGNGMTSTSVKRGCAPQTIDGDQAKINGKWQRVDTIYEVYQEGCQQNYDPDRPTKTLNCYCRGHHCNNSTKHLVNTNVLLIFLFITYYVNFL